MTSQHWNAPQTEAEYEVERMAEIHELAAHPELRTPDFYADVNDMYLPYQQADRPEPEPEAGL